MNSMLKSGDLVHIQFEDEQPIIGVIVDFDIDTGQYIVEYYYGNENLIEIKYISCYPRYCYPIQ